jgi:hypothetical protein
VYASNVRSRFPNEVCWIQGGVYADINNGRKQVKEPPRQTVIRRSDESKLEVGDTVSIKEGVVGVVLARFVPSGAGHNEVHYIVELRSGDTDKK